MRFFVVILLSLLLLGFAPPEAGAKPYSNERFESHLWIETQLLCSDCPPLEPRQNAKSLASLLLSQTSQTAGISASPRVLQRIADVFLRLFPDAILSDAAVCNRRGAEVTPRFSFPRLYFYSAEKTLPLVRISVFNDHQPNAYALPSNDERLLPPTVVVSSGLLALIQDDSELAFVIAHEMTHLRENHFAPPLPFAMLTARQLEEIENIHHSWEYKADSSAIELMRTRGMNAIHAIHLLERLLMVDSEQKEAALRQHPSIRSRIISLQSLTPVSKQIEEQTNE